MAARSVADAVKQPLDGDILIQVVPVDAGAAAAKFVTLELALVGVQKAREESQRYAENPAIGEVDGETVLIEGELGGFSVTRESAHANAFPRCSAGLF